VRARRECECVFVIGPAFRHTRYDMIGSGDYYSIWKNFVILSITRRYYVLVVGERYDTAKPALVEGVGGSGDSYCMLRYFYTNERFGSVSHAALGIRVVS